MKVELNFERVRAMGIEPNFNSDKFYTPGRSREFDILLALESEIAVEQRLAKKLSTAIKILNSENIQPQTHLKDN